MDCSIKESDVLNILGLNTKEFSECISNVAKINSDDIKFCVKTTKSKNNEIIYWDLSNNKFDCSDYSKDLLRIQIDQKIKKYSILLKNYDPHRKTIFSKPNSNKGSEQYFDRGHILGNWVVKCESTEQLLGECPNFFKKSNSINIVKQFKYTNSVIQKNFEDKARTYLGSKPNSKIYYEVTAVFYKESDKLPIGMYMSCRDIENNNYKFRVFFPNMSKIEAYGKEYKGYDARNTYANRSVVGIDPEYLNNE